MKLVAACDRFLGYCRHNKKLSEHTLRAYQIDLTEFLRFAGPATDLSECDRPLFHDYLRHLYEERNLKEASAKRRFACLKAMFRWLEHEEVIEDTPFRKLQLAIKLPARLPRGLTRRELRALLNAPARALGFPHREAASRDSLVSTALSPADFRQFTTWICLDLLFATGIRVSELTNIELDRLHLDEGVIHIVGKGDRERQVFITDQRLDERLRTYLRARRQLHPDHGFLITTPHSHPASTQYVRALVREAGERAHITRRITPHMLRHSAATKLLEAGVDIRFVQRLLGHQSITTTQIYTQVSNENLKRVIRKGHPLRDFT
ncbi:MAG: tyrosine-type recombinase/integrase [Chromatiales bacterium]|nr:tyrosine-type recombinase/integrase [Chromatiales bacterium]